MESVKAATDIYSPVSGEVIAVNKELIPYPAGINRDPYGSWIFELKLSNRDEVGRLLDADGYRAAIGE
ncbi:hypothetical protein [Streptomyces flavidovirens]|uniref:hypothetical protein n=1 Tax=Streptomyces flavidovirens TaxID=67298 RepID=UPI0003F77327|nr:hypothetical protein [Streptomyces flavidovirens]